MPDAIVHLRIPAATKARWVRESRAAGVRLTDWILQRVAAAGSSSPPADGLIAEARAEDAAGQPHNHKQGRA